MKRALITGSQGFVGGYLRQELEQTGYEVVGLDLKTGVNTIAVDLLNGMHLQEILNDVRPDAVFHLAGQANVGKSWSMPQKTVELNVVAAINLMEAVHAVNPECPMVMVGSSDQYGNLGEAGRQVVETMNTRPQTPYAVSKKAQEEMAAVYVKAYGMHICMTRSFNHGGAGQGKGFLIPDFASGIVAVERGEAPYCQAGLYPCKRRGTGVSPHRGKGTSW